MIASLKTMAKMFAKIAKTFDRLSTTIIAIRRRLALILHLEAKYAKMDCKNEIYAKNYVRSTWTTKSQQSNLVKVNHQREKSTDDVSRLTGDDISK